MMRLMIGRHKGFRRARSSIRPRARGGGQAVTRTSPQRNVERIGQPSHHAGKSHAGKSVAVMATARGRRWYATTVKNVLDRADVEAVKEAA